MKTAIGTLAVLALVTASRGAGAVEPEQNAYDGGDEPGLVAVQGLAGFGVSLGGLMLTGAGAVAGPVAFIPLFGTPYAVGMTVCGLGKRSKYHDGSCGASVGGAYVGALSMIPLVVLGYQLERGPGNQNDDFDGLVGALIGAAVGWLVVQPVASTVAWHISKRPRQPAVMPAFPPRPARPPSFGPSLSGHGRGRAPGQLTLTLLSAGF